ncbi:thioesterase family protein [Haloarculaceae archaeon H-GB2-1]|nr:thioesterase family protein [Haloarculaceae archaeon H-GB1-1]MEA5408097.1 thioesterase family protein [Haloarculaceae archaeon H-GB2-1]
METFTCTVPVRFSDLDAAGVVNNAVYATYLEEARVAFAREVVGIDGHDEFPFFVVSLDLEYHAPIRELADVTVAVTVQHVGETSFTLAYELTVDDHLVAEAETVQVAVDFETGEKRPVPEEWRARLG